MSMLPRMSPMRLARVPEPFDHNDWIFEIKFDGFRALAYVEGGTCRLVSRRNHVYRKFQPLCDSIARSLKCDNAVIDGEIVSLGEDGRSQFYELLFRRGEAYFYAFDLLWLNGEDFRDLPLIQRKRRLRKLTPRGPSRILYLDHLERRGSKFFEKACELDLEGIVAKPRDSRYIVQPRRSSWVKIKNPTYSQAEGREELFEPR
jgi:bifunctional non-homologous end joining protein LigD